DAATTERQRADIRDARRGVLAGRNVPAPEPWEPHRQGIRVAEAVFCEAVDGTLRLRCRCGHVLGPADRSPKIFGAMARLPVRAIGPEVNPPAVTGARLELREFYRPACLTRLEAEIARPDDPVIDDACVSVEWLRAQMPARRRN